jgi:signal transduction histidine kinase
LRHAFSPVGRSRSRLGGSVLLSGIVLVLVLVAGAAWVILDHRAQALADAETQTTSLSLALAEQTSWSFQAVDIVLKNLIEKIRADGATSPAALDTRMGTPTIHDMLRAQIVGLGQLDAITIVGADGELINTSRTWPSQPINAADRTYFTALRDTPTPGAFISLPERARANGVWTIFLARRLEAPDGKFIGIILGSVRLEYFETLYRAVSNGGRGVSLRRRDGTLLARHSRSDREVGSNVGDGEMLQAIQAGAATARSFAPSSVDGVTRLRIAQALRDFPLIIIVSRLGSAITAEWLPEAVAIGGGVLAAAAALLLGAVLLARQIARREASEAALAATFEHMTQGIMMIDRDGRIPVCNRRAMEMLDLPADLMAGQPRLMDVGRYQIAHGEYGPDGSGIDEMVRRLMSIGGVWNVPHSYERRRPNGTILEIRSVPLPDGGTVRSFTDVSEPRAREAVLLEALEERDVAEAALRQHRDDLEQQVMARTSALATSEARMREAIETIAGGFVLFDAQDRLVLCNAAYRALYGFSEDFAKPGVSFEDLVRGAVERGLYPDNRDIGSLLGERLAQHRDAGGDGCRFEQRLPDGRSIEIHERRTADGGIVGLRIDVTQARLHEAAEREREKLASLGQLAGGVAHELNNLLQPALTFPELVRDRLPADDTESREDLETVLDGARKARDIVRNILLYARKQEAILVPLDLGSEVHTALAFVRNVLPPGITLIEENLHDGVTVAANKTQLTQVLTNLVINAGHAMNGRGIVTVALHAARPGADQTLGIEPGHFYVAVTVTDNGSGMDEATQARIFEPFFTTKPLGEGTGLGLSVAYGILRSWNGAITVASAPGNGTTFTLYIPATQDAAASRLCEQSIAAQ